MSVAKGELDVGGKFGDYTVEKLLGEGGMGRVYLITGDNSGEQYAAKILNPLLEREDPEYKARFIFEAELAMQIRHENLIAVFDAGRDPDTGLGYLIMEYVPGGTLRDRIAKWGALSLEESTDIILRVARALTAVNERHIVHRDIKPDNIMFTADGVTPKLADLGIARVSKKSQSSSITQTGFMLGSPAYMAPEQMEDSHAVDIRADIHALGVTFWEMLAGERPYPDEDAMAIVARAMKGTPIPDIRTVRPDIPPRIAGLILRMTRPRAEDRIASPEIIVKELEAFRANPQAARRPRRKVAVPSERSKDAALRAFDEDRQPVVLYALVAGLLLSGLLFAVGGVMFARHAPLPPAPAAPQKKTLAEGAGAPEQPPPPAEPGPESEPRPVSAPKPSASAASEQTPAAAEPAPPPALPGPMLSPTPKPAEETAKKDEPQFQEPFAGELRHYIHLHRMARAGRADEARQTILDIVNAARDLDPDLRGYEWNGRARAAGLPVLPRKSVSVHRKGRLFLVFEWMAESAPDWPENYEKEKRAFTASLSAGRRLTLQEMMTLFSNAAGQDVTLLFETLSLLP